MTEENLKRRLDLLYRECVAAAERGEVPIAAMVFDEEEEVVCANRVEEQDDPLAHAEILAIRKMMKKKRSRYLKDCTLLVSLEPCLMCLGAILKAGIQDLYYVLDDDAKGAFSHYHVFADDVLRIHRIEDERHKKLMDQFFRSMRERNKRPKGQN